MPSISFDGFSFTPTPIYTNEDLENLSLNVQQNNIQENADGSILQWNTNNQSWISFDIETNPCKLLTLAERYKRKKFKRSGLVDFLERINSV